MKKTVVLDALPQNKKRRDKTLKMLEVSLVFTKT